MGITPMLSNKICTVKVNNSLFDVRCLYIRYALVNKNISGWSDIPISYWLIMYFRLLREEQWQQRIKKAFSSLFRIVHELEKAEINRQTFLRDAAMGP